MILNVWRPSKERNVSACKATPLSLKFTLIEAAKSFFVIPHDLKSRLCFGIAMVNFYYEFGICGMMASPAGFEPALPP